MATVLRTPLTENLSGRSRYAAWFNIDDNENSVPLLVQASTPFFNAISLEVPLRHSRSFRSFDPTEPIPSLLLAPIPYYWVDDIYPIRRRLTWDTTEATAPNFHPLAVLPMFAWLDDATPWRRKQSFYSDPDPASWYQRFPAPRAPFFWTDDAFKGKRRFYPDYSDHIGINALNMPISIIVLNKESIEIGISHDFKISAMVSLPGGLLV